MLKTSIRSLAAAGLAIGSSVVTAQTSDTITYQSIDRHFSISQNESLKAWHKRIGRKPGKDKTLLADLAKNYNQLPPIFLFHLAERTFEQDRKKALEWYWLGQVRARMDAVLCSDKTALQGTRYLPGFSPSVAKFAMENQKLSGEIALRTLDRTDLRLGTASPWWICSHGIQAFTQNGNQKTEDGRPWWLKTELQAATEYEGLLEGARQAFTQMAEQTKE